MGHYRSMTQPEPDPPEKRPISALPYAICVPILVVMAQSAWVVQGWNFRHNALLAQVSHPVVIGGMLVIAAISFVVLRPFVRTTNRWPVFLACVVSFTFLIVKFLPKLAE